MSFFITQTGCRIRDLANTPEQNLCVVRISRTGGKYQLFSPAQGTRRANPTSEFIPHLEIHQFLKEHKPERKAVLHTHATELIALSHLPRFKNQHRLNTMLWSTMPEVKVFVPNGIRLIPYQLSGSAGLAKATTKALRGYDVVLWEKHGVTAVGDSLTEAFDSIDVLNKSAMISFLCRTHGRDPEGISPKRIDELEETFLRKTG